jgi:hypothetical protein
MKLTSTEQFIGAAGEQTPEGFTFPGSADAIPAMTDTTTGGTTGERKPGLLLLAAPADLLETSIAGVSFEESSLSLATSQKNEMKIEVSSID